MWLASYQWFVRQSISKILQSLRRYQYYIISQHIIKWWSIKPMLTLILKVNRRHKMCVWKYNPWKYEALLVDGMSDGDFLVLTSMLGLTGDWMHRQKKIHRALLLNIKCEKFYCMSLLYLSIIFKYSDIFFFYWNLSHGTINYTWTIKILN